MVSRAVANFGLRFKVSQAHLGWTASVLMSMDMLRVRCTCIAQQDSTPKLSFLQVSLTPWSY